MLHIKKLEDGIELYKALGSELRIEIMKLLLEKGEMNMNEIASCLGITNGALTSHVRKLENCGLIQIVSEVPGHGNQKICRLSTQTASLIDIRGSTAGEKSKPLHGRYSGGTVYGLRHHPHLRHCHSESRHRRSGRSPVFCPSLPDAGRNSVVRQRFCGIPAPQFSFPPRHSRSRSFYPRRSPRKPPV